MEGTKSSRLYPNKLICLRSVDINPTGLILIVNKKKFFYYFSNNKILRKSQVKFLPKNLQQPAGAGKAVYTGRTPKQYPDLEHSLYLVSEVIVRTSTVSGQQFLIPDVQVDVYVTTRNRPPEVIIKLYHAHATDQ